MNKIILVSLLLLLPISAFANSDERLVVAGGSIVEYIFALGVGEQVVGVDQTTLWPKETAKLPKLGYWKQLSSEGIVSLNPDRFITWQDAGPAVALEQLKKLDVEVMTLPRIPATTTQMYKNINALAESLNVSERGKELVADIQQRLEKVEQSVKSKTQPMSALFILSVGRNAPMIAGQGSVANTILSLAGATNIASHQQYKPFSAEAIIDTNPDVIVVTSQMVKGDLANLANIPGIKLTSAWKSKRIVMIDQSLILGMGPRIADAVELLHGQFWQGQHLI